MLLTGQYSQPKQKEKKMRSLSYYLRGPEFLCGKEQYITFCSSHQTSSNKYLTQSSQTA